MALLLSKRAVILHLKHSETFLQTRSKGPISVSKIIKQMQRKKVTCRAKTRGFAIGCEVWVATRNHPEVFFVKAKRRGLNQLASHWNRRRKRTNKADMCLLRTAEPETIAMLLNLFDL